MREKLEVQLRMNMEWVNDPEKRKREEEKFNNLNELIKQMRDEKERLWKERHDKDF